MCTCGMRACMVFFLVQDVAHHQPKELVAKIEGRAWCGEMHLGRIEAAYC